MSRRAGRGLRTGPRVASPPAVVVDRHYVLAAAGLLAEDHPLAAHRLVSRLVTGGSR